MVRFMQVKGELERITVQCRLQPCSSHVFIPQLTMQTPVPGTNRCYPNHYKTGSQSNVPATFCSRSGNPVYSFTMRDIFQNGIPSPAPALRRPSVRKCRVWITASRSPQSQMSGNKKICARRRRPSLTRQSLDLAPKLRPIKRSFSWTRLLCLPNTSINQNISTI